MKCHIDPDGNLVLKPDDKTESYAITSWREHLELLADRDLQLCESFPIKIDYGLYPPSERSHNNES